MVYVCLLNRCFYAVVGKIDIVEKRRAAAHPASGDAYHDNIVVSDFVLVSDDFKLSEQQVEGGTGVSGFLLFAHSHPVVCDLFVDSDFDKRLCEVEFLGFAFLFFFVEWLVPVVIKEVLASLSERFVLLFHNSVSFCCPSLCCFF